MARTKAQVAADHKRTAAEKKRKEIAALVDSPAKEKDRVKKRKIKNDYKDYEAAAAKDEPIGQKRRRGRLSKATKTLIVD